MILTNPVSCVSDPFLLIAFLVIEFFLMLSSDKSYSFLLTDFIQLLYSGESDAVYDEFDNDWSDSGSAGKCAFPFS